MADNREKGLMGTFRRTPKICPKMEKPPKDSRKTAADARRRRLSGDRETPWMPFVISNRPPENACKNSGEIGRKDSALESKSKKPAWASPSCKTQKHTRKPPICAEVKRASFTAEEKSREKALFFVSEERAFDCWNLLEWNDRKCP